MMTKTYSDLIKLGSFEERFKYLILGGVVGVETFGFDRYLNQKLYKSEWWRNLRDEIIVRDNSCDMAFRDAAILGRIIIHHLNPINPGDLIHSRESLYNPENLVCVSPDTHQAIHYGNMRYIINKKPIVRKPWDTVPWRSET